MAAEGKREALSLGMKLLLVAYELVDDNTTMCIWAALAVLK